MAIQMNSERLDIKLYRMKCTHLAILIIYLDRFLTFNFIYPFEELTLSIRKSSVIEPLQTQKLQSSLWPVCLYILHDCI